MVGFVFKGEPTIGFCILLLTISFFELILSRIWYPICYYFDRKNLWTMNARSGMCVCCIIHDQSLKLSWRNYAVYVQCPFPGLAAWPSSTYSFSMTVRNIDSWDNWSSQFIAGTQIKFIRLEDSWMKGMLSLDLMAYFLDAVDSRIQSSSYSLSHRKRKKEYIYVQFKCSFSLRND